MSQSDFVSRGQALVAAGQFQEAVKVCRLGLLGRPTTVEGRVVLGQALLALKRYDEVLAEMRVALELDHTSVPAQVLKGEALLRKGDMAPAIDALQKARQNAPHDPRILQLLAEAEHGPSHRPSVSHPSVGFVGGGDMRQQYPDRSGDEPSGPEGFTRPTAMQSPGGPRRSSRKRAAVAPELTPPPGVLEVGDRSGTVEVDPDLEGVEVGDEIDFDDLAAPPKAKPAQARPVVAPRGVNPARPTAMGGDGEFGTAIGKKSAKQPMQAMAPRDTEEDERDEELAETRAPGDRVAPARAPMAGNSAVRNAVAMPSGVIGEANPYHEAPSFAARGKGKTVPPPRSKPPSAGPPINSMTVRGPGAIAPPTNIPPAGMIQRGPGGYPPAAPLPPAPIAAAMPTMNAVPPPPSPYAVPTAKPNLPTMSIAPPPPLQQENLFGENLGQPSWANATAMPPHMDPRSIAAANEPTVRPSELDPQILALMSGQPPPNPAVALDQIGLNPPPAKKMKVKTGMRRTRPPMGFMVWAIIGVVVIGGGVFAGFQIRKMRLEKQIVAARQRATDLAKADTWKGWRDARDSLAGIVQASSTLANRAALARTRALIAFEFGDGIVDAKADVEGLAGKGGLDGQLAAAYLALALSDRPGAKAASDAALAAAGDDAAAHYVAGHAALLAGDPKSAVTHMKTAADKEPRPMYLVGLARAQAAAYNFEEAITTIDKLLAASQDHPVAVLVRADLLLATGKITPGSGPGNELRAQLDRVVSQGKRPVAEQQHGVSPAQVAFGHLALAQVNFARNDTKAATNDLKTAAAINLDDQRFAEEMLDVLVTTGQLSLARFAADRALKDYGTSRRARIALARVVLAQGKPGDAIDIITKQREVLELADALAVRGQANLASGDLTQAAADFDAALKKVPYHEAALVGRAWLELASGEVEAATKRVAERYKPKGSSPALTTVYAATLRRSADPAQREVAKTTLETLVQSASGLELVRAQLELARLYRDIGQFSASRAAYQAAASTGNLEARLEHGLLLIEDRDPKGGAEVLEGLLREAGERPPAVLVIEGARARMLVGDHVNAAKLLELADKMSSVERWKLERERGRLSLRKSDFENAAKAFTRALDGCGGDDETFLLAADAGVYEKALADKVRKLAPTRLKGRPEAKIVEGKLLIAAEKYPEAEQAYKEASAALKADNASPRRHAQADFGLGVLEYIKQNYAEARPRFDLVTKEDPSLVDTYVFAADIANDPRKAFEFAKKAVQYNPDYAGAWLLVGKIAARIRDRKALTDAINRLTAIAPNGDELKELKALR